MPKPLVRLYPVPGVSAHPWPAAEFDATPEQWAELQTYQPPPFTDKPPVIPAQPEAPASPEPTED